MSEELPLLGPTPATRRGAGALPAPAAGSPLRVTPPPDVFLGTSSWSFPGWQGLVWDGDYTADTLARAGLPAYAALGLFQTVGIDRTFYAPLSDEAFGAYARQVRDGFRFLVKAPQAVTDAVIRLEGGRSSGPNPRYLDAAFAIARFVEPAMAGLGDKAGPLVFQFPPAPREILAEPAEWVGRLATFLGALPRVVGGRRPLYAVELRNAELVTPRLVRTLDEQGVRYVVGLHARMPALERQAAALERMAPGPVVVRWSLHSGFKYEQAKSRYFPFDRIVDDDPTTRNALARLAADAFRAGHPVWIIVNNKAEGSAPLSLYRLYMAMIGLIGGVPAA
ncbi:MAG: DUF72 domain-containing protein [Rhodospirillales bacterium]|nr:MAG: DUF72 domain-containing protein [Rhodospirillales bacterium]